MRNTTFVVDASGTLSAALTQVLAGVGYDAAMISPGTASVLTAADEKPVSVLLDLINSGSSLFIKAQDELLARGWRVRLVILTRAEDACPEALGPDACLAPHRQDDLPAGTTGRCIELPRSEMTKDVGKRVLFARYAKLTPRERQVAALVVRGLMNKEISAELRVAERTVKIHRSRAMTKLGVHCLPDLVRCIDMVGAVENANARSTSARRADPAPDLQPARMPNPQPDLPRINATSLSKAPHRCPKGL